MTKLIYLALFLLLATDASAQKKKKDGTEVRQETTAAVADTVALKQMAVHAAMFGNQIPQEKVFLHLDNTCYFLGDTIWFAAYTQQTNTGLPSSVSRVLYVELFNQDGYLMERQLIKMENGRGCGQFELKENYYGGYYELRAYTRWQLNFGVTEHEHTSYAKSKFMSEAMYRDYYRDYDKLYSRVFPVYDKPKEEGYFSRDMTLRPLRRYFRTAEEPPALVLSLFPEGGKLVAGVPCRVAFEAANEEGEWKEGRLELLDEKDRVVAKAQTEHRGRGTFDFTPQAGEKYTAKFYLPEIDTISDPTRKQRKHLIIKEKLPKAEEAGATVQVEPTAGGWQISVTPTGEYSVRPLGMTLMHEGRLEAYRKVEGRQTLVFPREKMQAGVHQVTVFDSDGRVLADRLFFETKPDLYRPTLSVTGLKERYRAFAPIDFTLNSQPYSIPADILLASDSVRRANLPTVSLSVRDAVLQDYTYDTGNIMTEMLLSSEIKGYVAHPDWYFEADDTLHHRALDLLMLTQGWRRFEWQTMALPKAFTLNHPAEYTQLLLGEVHDFYAQTKDDPFSGSGGGALGEPDDDPFANSFFGVAEPFLPPADLTQNIRNNQTGSGNSIGMFGVDQNNSTEQTSDEELVGNHLEILPDPAGGQDITEQKDKKKLINRLKREVLVHAEFYRPGDEGLEGEMMTEGGRFTIPAPDFEGTCFLMLAASDSTKWKHPEKPAKNIYRRIRQTHRWVSRNEDEYPEFAVRLRYPYPRFVKPYDYYQKHLSDYVSNRYSSDLPGVEEDRLHRNLKPITIRARHTGLRKFDKTKPAFRLDAYEAYNYTVEAGLYNPYFAGIGSISHPMAFAFVGDMNLYRAYTVKLRMEGYDCRDSRFAPPAITYRYSFLHNLDSTFIYTDYQPRMEGSERYEGDNQPEVIVNFNLIPNDGVRASYRDRRLVIDGFSVAEDFYHPNYHAAKPNPEEQKDYRRTLYWNPALPLDPSGRTEVKLFNNGKLTSVNVSAAGMTSDGQWLYFNE